MTSLQGSLPDSASGLWRMDREYGVSNTRVKHIVIHEAHIREIPDRHVVYRIDVFTQERNWCVYRRYSEFHKLHDKISDSFKMFKGSFPPKQLSGNLSPAIIEQRRSALEHYLLKIVNCHNLDVSSCPTVLRFLDLHHNDVYYVTSSLCRYVKTFGEAILNEAHYFVLSPTQLFCVHKRLRIPNSDADYKADTVFCDLGSLYDFLGRLNKVCIKPASLQDQGIRSELTLLKNIKELQIQTFSVSLIKGLATVQLQIQRLKACQAVTAMKDLLIDCVLERKTQPRQPEVRQMLESSEKMRDSYNSKIMFNSYTIHPWISLLYLDLSHNSIRQLDDSFSLLPNLQELDLSYNQIEVFDLNYINPALTKITCTHSNVMKVITKLHENLTDLVLSHNKITELTGFNKIVMLRRLNLYSNSITSVDSIACLTELPRLHDIAIAENPLSKSRSYRNNVLCMFTQACRRTDILVDGKGFSEKEKKRAKRTRVKGSTPHGPSALPFFGTSTDQIPTAFAQEQAQEDHWNSILHDTSTTTSDSEHSEGGGEEEEEEEEVQEALSPTLSEIRSTPSQTRTYDWDPAQAFASSAHSTPPSALPAVLSRSRQGSSTCLDKTSSCDEGELGEPVPHEDFSSLEPVSPLTEPGFIKPFNTSYYSFSGSSELYSSKLGTSPTKPGTSPTTEGSPTVRVNPFGSSPNVDSLSGSSKDLSDSSSGEEFNTCSKGEEFNTCSKGEEFNTCRDTSSKLEEKEVSLQDPTTEETTFDTPHNVTVSSGREDASFNQDTPDDVTADNVTAGDVTTHSKPEDASFNQDTADDVTAPSKPEDASFNQDTADDVTAGDVTAPSKPEDASFNQDTADNVTADDVTAPSKPCDAQQTNETASPALSEYFTPAPGDTPTLSDYVTPDMERKVNVAKEEDQAAMTSDLKVLESSTKDREEDKSELMPSGDDDEGLEIGIETFVVDRPGYEDFIFAGGTSPEVGEVCSGSLSDNNTHNLAASHSNRPPINTLQSASTNQPIKTLQSASTNQSKGSYNSPAPSPSPHFISHSPLLTRTMSPLLSDDSPVLPRNNPMLPRNSPVLPSDSPVSSGLTDHTSSGDEYARVNKIQSLSLSRDTDYRDLYDSDESEGEGEESEELSFSNTRLQF